MSTGTDGELRRSHSEQDILATRRQQELARAAEFYTAVGPDGELRLNMSLVSIKISCKHYRQGDHSEEVPGGSGRVEARA